MQYFLVFIGGGIGSALRFFVGSSLQRLLNGWILPVGTLAVNLIGCFIIGLVARLAESRGYFSGEFRLFITVGILGGFTTFSSFSFETVQLFRDGQYLFGIANVLLQVFFGLTCVYLGANLARLL